jgi:hypothetical protein
MEPWGTQDLTAKSVGMFYDEGLWSNRAACIVDVDVLTRFNPGEFSQPKSIQIRITVVLWVACDKVTVCIVEIFVN